MPASTAAVVPNGAARPCSATAAITSWLNDPGVRFTAPLTGPRKETVPPDREEPFKAGED